MLVDDTLNESPSDPEALFIDAYLIWKQDSARACEHHIAGALSRIDRPRRNCMLRGRARLLNLRGCAFDELKEYPEAIACLEEAVRADPKELSYLANLAEVHEKCGDRELARSLAEQAARGGYSSVLVERLRGAG